MIQHPYVISRNAICLFISSKICKLAIRTRNLTVIRIMLHFYSEKVMLFKFQTMMNFLKAISANSLYKLIQVQYKWQCPMTTSNSIITNFNF